METWPKIGYFLISFAKISQICIVAMFTLLRHLLIDLHEQKPERIIVSGMLFFVYLLRMTLLSMNVFQHFPSLSQWYGFYTMKHSHKLISDWVNEAF